MGSKNTEFGQKGAANSGSAGATPEQQTLAFADKKNGYEAMTINFECKKCWSKFDCDVGKIGIDDSGMRPTFSKDIVCPRCGKLTMDDVLLTELGQGQMTQATMGL